MSRKNRAAIIARHHAVELAAISTAGTAASLLIWIFAGWFWAVCGLILVCILLTVILFNFVDPPAHVQRSPENPPLPDCPK